MRYLLFFWLFSFAIFTGCNDSVNTNLSKTTEQHPASLGQAFVDDFTVGVALSKRFLRGRDPQAMNIAAQHFTTITPENDLKWGNIHPARDTFVWEPADAFVKFGEEHDMFIVGHALVWYLQLADYVSEVTDTAEMRTILREHIEAVAGRYRGRIDAWDVLNEAVEDNGDLRPWVVPDLLGEDYVAEVFKMARVAAPDAELYYNDYNLWMPAKRDGAIRMLKKAIAAGAPIDGIGMQGHYSLTEPTTEQVAASIEAFHQELGLPVMITELDITVLPNPWKNLSADPRISFENTPYMNPYTDGLPDSTAQDLADRYANLFRLFLKHKDKIQRVTFWGIYDGSTWLNNFPIKGRTNYPLLFDRQYQPKAAFKAVKALKE